MTSDHWDAGEHRAWSYYKRTGVILPSYQGAIADRIAELERERVTEEPSTTEEDVRLKV